MNNIGIYLHIPFCEAKCNYCHFVTRPMQGEVAEKYCRALVRELQAFGSENGSRIRADTVYFGGGTPSVVPGEHIARILDACRGVFALSEGCEISLEANPGSLTPAKVALYRRSGVNRVSLGAQSFDDAELQSIGRDHTGKDVRDSIAMLRAGGIDNINLDLMLGLPGQNPCGWQSILDHVAHLLPDHLSVYMLDLHESSPLYHLVAKGRQRLPEDDLIADLYLATVERLGTMGFQQYEISNFARAGRFSRHNLKYWKREPVLGFGVGSHSFDGFERYANVSSLGRYLSSAEAGISAVEWRRSVGPPHDLEETIFLGLRLNEGLNWSRVRAEHGLPRTENYETTLRGLSERGLIEWGDSSIRLTPTGMLLSNEIFCEFIS